MLKTRHSLQKK